MPDPTTPNEPVAPSTPTTLSRRGVIAGGAAAGALAVTGAGIQSAQAKPAYGPSSATVTILGTTDLHGNVFNWDYFANKEFDNSKHDAIGLAKVSTLVKDARAEFGTERTMLIDAGDTIQGTPLAYYYARIDPITGGHVHPMAAAMNQMAYDAAALGNHEFNYGIPLLRAYQDQLDFPLLGANALDAHSKQPAFPPYAIHKMRMPDGSKIKVGILGLTNPGSRSGTRPTSRAR